MCFHCSMCIFLPASFVVKSKGGTCQDIAVAACSVPVIAAAVAPKCSQNERVQPSCLLFFYEQSLLLHKN